MKSIGKCVNFISFPTLLLLLMLFGMKTPVYAAEYAEDAAPDPMVSYARQDEAVVGSLPEGVVEIESHLLQNEPYLIWDNEAVVHAYAVVELTFSVPGEGDVSTEERFDDPDNRYYGFDSLAEENIGRPCSYTVQLYDDADRLVGMGSGGPFTFHKVDIIPEVFDEAGNPVEDNSDYKGNFFSEKDSGYVLDIINRPNTYILTDFEGRLEIAKAFSGYEYTETEINGTIYTESTIEFACDCDTTITLRFRQSSELMPVHIDIGSPTDDYPNLAVDLVDALNDNDALCDAVLEPDGKTVTFKVLKAQNRSNFLIYVKNALRNIDFSLAYSNSILLSFEESYPSYDAYNGDNLFDVLQGRALTENMTLYMIWCEQIDMITLTITPPAAGTEVTREVVYDEDGTRHIIQTNGPRFVQDEESSDKVDLDAYWGADMASTSPFQGTIEEDAECPVVINFNPHFGYVVNKSTLVIVNGKMITPSAFLSYFFAQTSLKSVAALPSFTTHSLTLDGLIGVNFFMDLPELPGVNYEESYMEFTISGKGGTVTKDMYDADDMSREGGYFGFTRYVSSVQMADTITATFHYGSGFTVTDTYSVADYVQDFENEKDDYDAATAELVYALADYGHFVQPMLAKTNGWELGTDHAVMPGHTESFGNDEISLAANEVSGYTAKCPLAGSGIKKIRMCLLLDSSTTLVLRITPASTSLGGVSYSVDGQASGSAKALSDGRYEIALPDISAVELGKAYSVKMKAQKDVSLDVSPLAYINTVMHSDTYQNDADMQNAMTALYLYYKAADAFEKPAI